MLSLLDVATEIGFCRKTAEIWQLVGTILMVIKIVFPLLVVIFGIIDIGKSVVAQKPEEISKSFKSFLYRLAAAVAIFFIPTVVAFGINLAHGFQTVNNDYSVCSSCISNPNGCDIGETVGK